MIILYVLLGVIIYSTIVIVVGKINFNQKLKRRILITLSAIYNGFMGYIDTYTILLMYAFLSNSPKGSGYEVPESEAGFNAMLGVIILFIYLIILIPLNIYMKKKGKISIKIYAMVNIISTILGITIFWLFLDKSRALF